MTLGWRLGSAPMDITATPQWEALTALPAPAHLGELFAADPGRAERYLVTVGDLRIDYSKQRVDDAVLAALLAVAGAAGVAERRDAMFGGERINVTEDRAVLHVALRADRDAVLGPVGDGRHGRQRRARRPRRARRDGRVRRAGPQRHVDRAPPASASARSSTSASAAPISARRWPTGRCGRSRHPELTCRFVSNVDGADDRRAPSPTSTRPRRCSSSRRRRSRRSRR